MAEKFEKILYEKDGRIAIVTINRPERMNAIDPQTRFELLAAMTDFRDNDDLWVAILTGAGERAFSAGNDLVTMSEMMAGKVEFSREMTRAPFGGITRGFECWKPMIAAINGYCLAGGTGFMLACDIVIAAEHAKFGTPEVNVGLWPMMIGALIFRNVPRKKAMEMIMLGEKLSAVQALEMGMLTRVVPSDKLDEEVNGVLQTLAKKSPIGMKIGKRAFYEMDDMPFEQALDFLAEKLMEVASTEDAIEGITSFMQKRDPVFKGK